MLKNKRLKSILAVILVACFIISIGFTWSFFTDRVSHKMKFTTAIFAVDGYAIERVAPDGPFVAGEDVEVTLKESNTGSSDIKSVITMTTKWDSPDSSLSIFGNTKAEDNAALTIDGANVSYTVNDDGTITYVLPEHTISAGAKDVARELVLHIPDAFKSTGEISYTFDKVAVVNPSTDFSEEFSNEDLNESEAMDFAVRVGWAASNKSDATLTPNGHKALMGYLTEKDANDMYGIEFKFEFNYDESAMKDFVSKTDAKWMYYKEEVNRLDFAEGMTTIGDYAFPDFEEVTSITLPESVTAVGTWAFDNTSITELTVPAKVATLETMSFGHINELTEITFDGATGKDITFPEEAGADTGAFYVYPYVDTTINGTNTDALAYDWITDLRNPPTLAANTTWYNNSALQRWYVTNITVTDDYTVTGNETASWPAAVDRDGDGTNDDDIMCYLNDTELTIFANTATRIYMNEDSDSAFFNFVGATSFDGIEMFDPCKTVNMQYLFQGGSFTELNVADWDVSNVENFMNTFCSLGDIEALDVSKWDTGSATTMQQMFGECYVLKDIDVSAWDTRNVTTTRYMFQNCNKLETLDLSTKPVTMAPNAKNPEGKTYNSWDTGNVKVTAYMFKNDELLSDLDISTWDTRSVVDMQATFENCEGLETLDVSPKAVQLNGDTVYAWDTKNVESMYLLFKNCISLKSLDLSGWDTSGIGTGENSSEDDFQEMFYGCTALETLNVSRKSMTGINGRNYTSWDTSNAQYMDDMFNGCSSLKSLNLSNWNNAKTEDMGGMFENCSSMTSINLTNFTTPSLDYASAMFYNCSSLTEIDVSSFDTSNISYMINMFGNCSGLTTLDLSNFVTTGLGYSRYFAWFAKGCTNLTTIILNEDFGQEGILPSAGSSDGLFYVGDPYSSTEPLRTKVVGANDVMKAYDWGNDNRGYAVTVEEVTGGTITVSPVLGISGKSITITDTPNNTPNNRYLYDGATVSYNLNGTAKTITLDKDTRTFVMPEADVTVTPKWKKDDSIYITLKYMDDKTPDETIKYTGQTLPTPTNGDYKFKGWYVGESEEAVVSPDFTNPNDTYPWTKDANGVWSSSNAGVKSSTSNMLSEEFTIPFGGGTVSFDWRSNGEKNYDYLGYDILNVTTGEYLSGNETPTYKKCLEKLYGKASTSFTTVTKELEGGTYKLLFMYGKDGSGDSEEDKGFVKNVQVSYLNWGCAEAFNGSATDGMTLVAKWGPATPPTFASGSNWYAGSTAKSTITTINMVDSYTATGNETESWPAAVDADGDGTLDDDIMCYVNGTELTIVGNGTGSLMGNNNSWRMFYDFTNVTAINGLKLLDTSDVSTMSCMFEGCNSLKSLDLSGFNTEKVTSMYLMFGYCNSLESLDVSSFNTEGVTNMATMFYDCFALTSLDVSSFKTTNVTTMKHMLWGCTSLTSLNLSGFNTNNVTDMTGMVGNCPKLTTITLGSNFGQSGNVAQGMFYVSTLTPTTVNGANSVMKAYDWEADNRELPPMLAEKQTWYTGTTSKYSITKINFVNSYTATGNETESWPAAVDADGDGTNDDDIMCYVNGTTLTIAGGGHGTIIANINSRNAFSGFSGLTAINGLKILDTSNVTDMGNMFLNIGVTSLDVSSFDTSNVTAMDGMFWQCALTTLDLSSFDTSVVTTMSYMFYNSSYLETVNLSSFDTSNVTGTGLTSMFEGCESLTSLDVSNFNTNNVTSLGSFAKYCTQLTTIILNENFGQSSNVKSNMFLVLTSTPTTVYGANDVMKAYDWTTAKRTVTFANALTMSVSNGAVTGYNVE